MIEAGTIIFACLFFVTGCFLKVNSLLLLHSGCRHMGDTPGTLD